MTLRQWPALGWTHYKLEQTLCREWKVLLCDAHIQHKHTQLQDWCEAAKKVSKNPPWFLPRLFLLNERAQLEHDLSKCSELTFDLRSSEAKYPPPPLHPCYDTPEMSSITLAQSAAWWMCCCLTPSSFKKNVLEAVNESINQQTILYCRDGIRLRGAG